MFVLVHNFNSIFLSASQIDCSFYGGISSRAQVIVNETVVVYKFKKNYFNYQSVT